MNEYDWEHYLDNETVKAIKAADDICFADILRNVADEAYRAGFAAGVDSVEERFS